MKILVVSSFLPYPLYSGGYIRLYNLLKYLSKKHEITLVCERRETESDEDVREVEKICKKVITIPRKKQWSAKNIVKAGFSTDPFLIVGHTLPEMKKIIVEELNSKNYDLIHAETFYIMQNIPKTYIPIVLAEHNIEYLVYKRFGYQASFLLRPLLLLDVYKLKVKEEIAWKRATKLVAVSEEEKKLMKFSATVIVPNGVDTQQFRLKNLNSRIKKKEKKILFIGDFRWVQNRDAIRFIINDIWPKIKLKINGQKITTGMKLWIVGRVIPPEIRSLTSDPDIVFDENAPDTVKVYRQADILLAPIRIGGGTQYKILEAMASGTPVITTPLGAEGLDIVPEKHLLIGESTEELVALTIKVVENKKLFNEIAENARKLIEEKYNWEKITQILDRVYYEVAQNET